MAWPPPRLVSLPNLCSGLLLEQEARAVAKWLGVDFAKIAHPKYMLRPLVSTVDKVSVVSASQLRWALMGSAFKRLTAAPTDSVGVKTETVGMLYALPLCFRPKTQLEKEFPRAKLPAGLIGTLGYAVLLPSLRQISFSEGMAVIETAKTIRITYANGSPIGGAVARAVVAELRRRKSAPIAAACPPPPDPPAAKLAPGKRRLDFSHLA